MWFVFLFGTRYVFKLNNVEYVRTFDNVGAYNAGGTVGNRRLRVYSKNFWVGETMSSGVCASIQFIPTELLGRVTSRRSATANLLKLLTIIYFHYTKYIIVVARQLGLSRCDSPLSNNVT